MSWGNSNPIQEGVKQFFFLCENFLYNRNHKLNFSQGSRQVTNERKSTGGDGNNPRLTLRLKGATEVSSSQLLHELEVTISDRSVMNSLGNLQFPAEACYPNQLCWKPRVPGWETESAVNRLQWWKGNRTCSVS